MIKKIDKIYKQTLELIDKHKLIFIEDIVSFLPITKTTFYDYFKIDSNEMDAIKGALNKNRIELKVSMRSKWYKSENPTLQMGLYKLLANEDELDRLNGNKTINVNTELPKISIEYTN